jgi:hypothetical protein
MTFALPCISINAPTEELKDCIENSNGVLLVKDFPTAPFESILDLLQHSNDVTNRLNQACPKNLAIYRDTHATGNAANSSRADRKRSLDLSQERLEGIGKSDPGVVHDEALQKPLSFFKAFQESVEDKLVPAFAQAIGGSTEILDSITINYRMLDYYPSANEHKAVAPRLAAHRDFGFITLIQATHPGLQVFVDSKWQDLPPTPHGSAVILFGWCAKVRSNGRIPATLHRVTKHLDTKASRISAVLFVNPKRIDTSLEPVVRSGEARKYINGVKAADLQKRLAESKTEKYVDKWLENCTKKPTSTRFWSRFRRPATRAA